MPATQTGIELIRPPRVDADRRRKTVRRVDRVFPIAPPADTMSWRTKLILAVALTLWMTVPYHAAQTFAWRPAVTIPETAFDRWIGFHPGTAWAYLSLFPLTMIVPLRFTSRRTILQYAAGFILMGFVGAVIFFAWPTTVDRPPLTSTDWAYRLVVSTDRPTNACPSMHAAMAIFAALAAAVDWTADPRGLRRLAVWVWALVILYATLATRQHMVIDLTAGGVVGLGSFLLSHLLFRSRHTTDRTLSLNRL